MPHTLDDLLTQIIYRLEQLAAVKDTQAECAATRGDLSEMRDYAEEKSVIDKAIASLIEVKKVI